MYLPTLVCDGSQRDVAGRVTEHGVQVGGTEQMSCRAAANIAVEKLGGGQQSRLPSHCMRLLATSDITAILCH